MARASFYVNDLKIRRKGEYIILEARKKCQQGMVFDEIFLTLPGELGTFFTMLAKNHNSQSSQDNPNQLNSLTEHFKRFTGDN